MESLHWAYLVPLGIAFLFGAYLAADVEVSRAENSPTSRLRLMLLVFGLAFLYLGFLAWSFDLSGKLNRIVYLIGGLVLVLAAALRSRAGLIEDSDYFTKPPYDIDLDSKTTISPAERVKGRRDAAGTTKHSDQSHEP